ncbi:MAG: hypothetical protein AB3N14_09525 [Flavobacteriaceae bacterium]
MAAKFDMSVLFEKSHKVDIKEHEIFKKAALIYHFRLPEDFEEFDEEARQTLKEHAVKKPEGVYRLTKEDRLEILSEGIGLKNIENAIEKHQVGDEYTGVLRKFLTTDLTFHKNSLSNAELYYALILGELFLEQFQIDELRSTYQRRHFFKPFQRITQNFAGREQYLKEINDYVDWLPKSTLVKQLSATFKNIINWHEKPPLLIKGIGGIGKSTLVSKFIMNHNNQVRGRSLPFVYIDFDMHGFSIREPLTILIEALRQIRIQYPHYTVIVNKISEDISNMIHRGNNRPGKARKKSSASSRDFIYDYIRDLINSYDLQNNELGKRPVLVVFDSFEEMQYRATSTQLRSFFLFVREIAELIPRVRPIFVGRAEIAESFNDFEFQTITITDFDADAAAALMEHSGIKDEKVRDFIYQNFGGNPLMLRLAIDLAKKENLLGGDEKLIRSKKWEYLINRILGHIHREDVRKVAVPGMLVRYVNPDVISKVLAQPTKLGKLKKKEANEIFEELKKEVSLISRSVSQDEFSFRQDLRMVCEPMILEKYPEDSYQLRQNAIGYYSKYDKLKIPEERDKHQAEYYYHLMKSGEIPENLTPQLYEKLRPYIDRAIIELPESARLYLLSLGRQNVAEDIIDNSTNQEWEYYHVQLCKDALNGELSDLKDLFNILQEKPQRIANGCTELGKYEALLYQRLDNIGLSQELIAKALSSTESQQAENRALTFDLQLIQVQNLEYEERYAEALKLCEGISHLVEGVGINSRMIFSFLYYRIANRIEAELPPHPKDIIGNNRFEYREDFEATKWEFIFRWANLDQLKFAPHQEFNSKYRKTRNDIRSLKELEGYSYKILGYFLKDITYSGEYNIVMRDFLFADEIFMNNPIV